MSKNIKMTPEQQSTLMICKSCGKKISLDSKKCVHCGAEDPFFFNEFISKRRSYSITRFIILIIYIVIICNIGLKSVLWFIVLLIAGALITEYIKKYQEKDCIIKLDNIMYNKCLDKFNDSNEFRKAYNTWMSVMDSLKSK